MRFQFYAEMDDLLEVQQDVVFPVVGTTEGLKVCRPEALGYSSTLAFPNTVSSPIRNPGGTPTATTSSRKRRRVDDEVMQFLQQSKEAS
ncbi:uncharacterized protein AKAME5_000809300 [Lates japonicus]|uniref:Uncharacterized protein n=1 Tax=Lates japonicus TaxID=270547 RepID=A0AAD3R590_LATJO|nr:uncharacterized protein AKAME5_000809300 [Lates japonicus]